MRRAARRSPEANHAGPVASRGGSAKLRGGALPAKAVDADQRGSAVLALRHVAVGAEVRVRAAHRVRARARRHALADVELVRALARVRAGIGVARDVAAVAEA